MNLEATELRLGLPTPETLVGRCSAKRPFSDSTTADSNGSPRDDASSLNSAKLSSASESGRAVGWPPVREGRKKVTKSCKYVKVAVDGAPYLRKLDLEIYDCYHQLLVAIDHMIFNCFPICNYLKDVEREATDMPMEYVATYEDKDGDWMLVGDVPWKMFVESCKRLRLMKTCEALGLGPTPQGQVVEGGPRAHRT